MGSKRASKSTRKQKQSFHHWMWKGHPRLWKGVGIGFGLLALLTVLIFIAFQVSPWPKAWLIRYEFDRADEKVSQALQKHVPAGIADIKNQVYRSNDADALLNVFYPVGAQQQLPTIVWVHGGAWVAGGKDDIDNYLRVLASHGFTTVSVNYSLAPEKQYPTPIVQLNDALRYLQQHAQRLHVDDTKILLAGDSAGSQIVAQMANIVTSESYADEMDIQPTIAATKLKALLLNCGAYDLALPDYSGPFGDFLHTVLWAYSGTKDFLNDPKLKSASVANYLTNKFPPAFITAGNVDPLLSQSTELAKKLQQLGVHTQTLFYPANHQPQLNHEYQFDLDTADGQKALQIMVDFARQHTK